jgi:hypothetical protein
MIAVERLTLDWGGIKTDLMGALSVDDAQRLSGELLGSLDAGALLGALSGGQLNLKAMNAQVPISLRFRNGDIEAGLSSGLPRPGR